MTETTTQAEQPSQEGRLGGRLWQRASAYEIAAGMIRPLPGAAIEDYDPWALDAAAVLEEERPYKQLLRLAQRIDVSAQRPEPRGRQRAALLDWVAHNGLLGILPHETLEFVTAPRWREFMLPGITPDTLMAPYQKLVRRSASTWRTGFTQVGAPRPIERSLLGQLVAEDALNARARVAHASYRSWPSAELGRANLERRWAPYFSHLSPFEAQHFDYAAPSEAAFWQHYGEPIGAFVRRTRALAEMIEALEGRRATETWRQQNAVRALSELNDAAFGSSLAAYLDDDDEPRLHWMSASLCGCYAVMLLQDVAGTQSIRRCPVCGGIFLSGAQQARFCSATCRYTHHKREQRKRAKANMPEQDEPR